ncbi:tyrosine-type recombinase/integrase [Streptomyces phaeoluteigriseus]|uniref:tyrosine-type recombinase/integrase n=1 Tax=Streptomyces phaeoluteigriseus TaxID=114686 RepID=UPI000B17778D
MEGPDGCAGFAEPGRSGRRPVRLMRPKAFHVFVGPRGGHLRRSKFRDDWITARDAAGITSEPHFHDLRRTGNTLESTAGVSTRELMTRMGHSSSRAALIYRHVTGDRDRAIAHRLGAMIREGGGEAAPDQEPGLHAAVVARVWHDPGNDEGPAREGSPPAPALRPVPPAGFEPATPASGVRSTAGLAGARLVHCCRTRPLVAVAGRCRRCHSWMSETQLEEGANLQRLIRPVGPAPPDMPTGTPPQRPTSPPGILLPLGEDEAAGLHGLAALGACRSLAGPCGTP